MKPTHPKAQLKRRLARERRRRLNVEFMPGEPAAVVFYHRKKRASAFKMGFLKKRK